MEDGKVNDFQELVRKYTVLVSNRIYGKQLNGQLVNVIFLQVITNHGEPLNASAINRTLFVGTKHELQCPLIEYNGVLFDKFYMTPRAWSTIVHEITHFEVNVQLRGKQIIHPQKFKTTYKGNLARVKDLRKNFYMEAKTLRQANPKPLL